jgi:hypothetical protein
LPGPLCFHPNLARFSQKEPKVIELRHAGIDAFLASTDLPTPVRISLLREALRDIHRLVDLAAELRDSTRQWGIALADNEKELNEFGLPPEFEYPELYIEYYARLTELKYMSQRLNERIDVGDDAINRIAALIAQVLPVSVWFKDHDRGFAVEAKYIHDYDRDYTRWKLLICKWEEHGPQLFNK